MVIDEVIELLQREGWDQGLMKEGANCLGTAWIECDRGDEESALTLSAIESEISQVMPTKGFDSMMCLVAFNDEVAETLEDVTLLLKRAKEGLEG